MSPGHVPLSVCWDRDEPLRNLPSPLRATSRRDLDQALRLRVD